MSWLDDLLTLEPRQGAGQGIDLSPGDGRGQTEGPDLSPTKPAPVLDLGHQGTKETKGTSDFEDPAPAPPDLTLEALCGAADPIEARYLREERAAILEHLAGLPSADADRRAGVSHP